MNTFRNGPELLREYVGPVKSRMGAAFEGSHVIFRGQNLHTDLKEMSWPELYVFGITGRRFSAKQLHLLEAIWRYISYPDVRIWNNRVAGLAGSVRSTGSLGIAASLAVAEGSIYGRGSDISAITFFIQTLEQLDQGKTLEECVCNELQHHRRISGYGRPFINKDERNRHLLALAKDLGLDQGRYLRLALDIDHFLVSSRRRIRINYGGLAAALGADLGLSPQEYYLCAFPAFLAGIPPCYMEAAERPEGVLFPVSCVDIVYEGPAQRAWSKPE